jgi:parallel beta-helix repeat protein
MIQNTNNYDVNMPVSQIIVVNSTLITVNNKNIDEVFEYGIYIAYSSNISILNSNFSNIQGNAIEILYSYNITIDNNFMSNIQYYAINSDYSDNNVYTNNIFNFSSSGIKISYSDLNYIYNNTIDLTNLAFDIRNSLYNSILANKIRNSSKGIYYLNSHSNIALFNTIANITTYGIESYNSNYLNLTGNVISGLNKYYGIYLRSGSSAIIMNNTVMDFNNGFYLNSISNNTIKNNNLHNNTIIISGNNLDHYLQYEFSNNTFNEKSIIYLQNNANLLINNDVGQVIVINSDNIQIEDLIFNEDQYNSIFVAYSTNIKITNCTMDNSGTSIQVIESDTVTINKNTFYNGLYGMWLTYTDNTNITNNTFNSVAIGIALHNSYGNNVKNNTVFNSSTYGIDLFAIQDSTVFLNTITNSSVGIRLYSTSNNTISHNKILNSSDKSIHLYSSNTILLINNNINFAGNYGVYTYYSNNNHITGNQINNSLQEGIYLYRSDDNIFSNNTVENSTNNGFKLFNSKNNIITSNTIMFSGEYGVSILDYDNNTIKWNNFIKNNIYHNQYQALDNGTLNSFEYNYWNELPLIDNDSNGIIDNNYNIEGTANNNDPTPVSSLIEIKTDHPVTTPQIIYPSGGDTVSDIVSLDWTISIDSELHPIAYSVYYSSDNGISWNLIATDLINTKYDWNTQSLGNGSTFLIKVTANTSDNFSVFDITEAPFSVLNYAHILMSPSFTYPYNNQTISDIFIIEWNPAIDSKNHNVSYLIYYSGDNGLTWAIIALDIILTNYSWDTKVINDGEYILKLVATDGEILTEIQSDSFILQNKIHELSSIETFEPLIINSYILLQWTTSIDSLAHKVFYSLYFSNDSDQTWYLLHEDLNATSFLWQDHDLMNETELVIKIITTDQIDLSIETILTFIYIILDDQACDETTKTVTQDITSIITDTITQDITETVTHDIAKTTVPESSSEASSETEGVNFASILVVLISLCIVIVKRKKKEKRL